MSPMLLEASLGAVVNQGGDLLGTSGPATHSADRERAVQEFVGQIDALDIGQGALTDEKFDLIARNLGETVALAVAIADECEMLNLAGTDAADLPRQRL